MVKKRKTKAATRGRPKTKMGSIEEADVSREQREAKLRTLLQDFDTHVSSILEEHQNKMRDFEKTLNLALFLELSKLPKTLKEFGFKAYIESLKSSDSSDPLNSTKVTEELTQSVESRIDMMAITSLAKSVGKTTSFAEDEPKTTKRGRKKKSTSKNTGMNAPSTQLKTRTTRQKTLAMKTPANQTADRDKFWGDTPLITPKFDPRLPFAAHRGRAPKVGERIMSLAGSPISIAKNEVSFDPMSRKTTIVLNNQPMELEDIKIPNLNNTTLSYLKSLRQRLNQLPMSPP